MAGRDGPVGRARRLAKDDYRRVLDELGRAQRSAGLSDADVGRTCGLSRWVVARILTGNRPATSNELAAIGGVVGLDVRLRAYLAGDPIRDAGQQRLLGRLRDRIDRDVNWRTEVPLPNDGDRRAWDAVITGRGWRIAIEAETVIDDVQALERRLGLKRRDGGIEHVILLVAETRRNRRAIAAAPGAFTDLHRKARVVLKALAAGSDPGMDALLFL